VDLRDALTGALVMAPMTKGSNLPYRRLAVELGAHLTVSETTVVRRLKQRRNSEFALIRRFEGEPGFGVQLAGIKLDELAWAAALVAACGALIKPWIFREAVDGYRDVPEDERVGIYRRYAALARAHWGADEHGLARTRQFVRWHLDFWSRYRPRRPDGSFPTLQVREPEPADLTPLGALLARRDEAAHDYLADCLTYEREIDAADAPPATAAAEAEFAVSEG
jgi:tRNA-dihydrouridine synthase